MAFKCLPSILSGLAHKNKQAIYIGVDAQIVLSWILTKNVKAKNVFASNRIKDISNFRAEISTNHGIDVRFKYIPTDLNVADLVTKGISLKTLKGRLEIWHMARNFYQSQKLHGRTLNWDVCQMLVERLRAILG